MTDTKDQFSDGNPDYPHIFIQWKGTNVCADVHCTCGEHGHVDAEFCYFVKCPKCGTVWQVGSNVALRPASAERLVGVSEYAIKTWEPEPE